MITKKDIKRVKFWVFITFFVLSFLLVLFSGLINFNETSLGNLLAKSFFVSILLYTILIALTISTSLPSSIVALAGTAIFPLYLLIPLTIIGMLIGLSFIFYFTKRFGEEGIKMYSKLEGKKLQAFLKLIKMNSTSFVILFTFFYFLPSNLASVVGAITDMKFRKFALIALIGNSLNLLAFILLSYGVYSANLYYIIPSFIILLAMSITPLYLYRKNIKDILEFILGRKIKLGVRQ